MKTPEVSFHVWQRTYHNQHDCIEHLKILKWPNGFMCPRCAQRKGIDLRCWQMTEFIRCHKQTSVRAGTLFHRSQDIYI